MTPRTQKAREGYGQLEAGPVTAGFGLKEVTGMCGTVRARAKWMGARDGRR